MRDINHQNIPSFLRFKVFRTANQPALNVEAVFERLLGDLFESEEAAQRDYELEQLNKIFEVEEAAQRDHEQEQLNSGFFVQTI